MTNAPACPRCGAPAAWKAQANGWGCDRCQQMLPPPGPPPQMAVGPPPGPGAGPTNAPSCPRCTAPAVWHAQVGKWGCDRCRAYLDTMGASPPPPGAQLPPPDVRAAKRAIATKRVVFGLILIVIGIVITAATYNSAVDSGGGTYFIAYGPIVVGGIRFFQGLGGLMV